MTSLRECRVKHYVCKILRSENYYVQRVAERRFPINHGNISQNIHKVVEQ